MLNNIVKKLIGSRNDRQLRRYYRVVHQINELEAQIQALSDDQLRAKTDEFRQRVQVGKESLDAILPEAFAVVREVAQRTVKMRHFDVQLIGGMILHHGKVAEMRTGEGKTLMSTLAIYLNALSGKGVHVVTVNDYLAQRDAQWMKPVYDFLGVTLGVNIAGMEQAEKKAAYAKDITYGTNNEFGFDYLRDNMVFQLEQQVQRPLSYAVIDEVDSVLIDEARTPLIISGQLEESSDLYHKLNQLIPELTQQIMEEDQKEEELPEEKRGDYTLDEKNRQAFLTERGHQKIEKLLTSQGLMKEGESLYDLANISLMHYVSAALRAHTLFQRDVHYIVKNNEILIVDEHTGRLMPGRRWSDGLHQAVEAKENVAIQLENQTLATITFQNYFRLYDKLSGMTGTADTEAFELQKIYALEVIVVPTSKPMIRKDEPDRVYLTAQAKYQEIVKEIKRRVSNGQPVLVGTASIDASELMSRLLTTAGISHEVLNAKQHQREAKIIAQAGRPAAVTIATNMAGRGTDIVLGGNVDVEIAELQEPDAAREKLLRDEWRVANQQVLSAGGLHVLGTERNEARRIDNQLRGRSGRQGDPGSSQFYLSLEDNLLRIFASGRMSSMMRRLGVKDDDVIESNMVSRAIESAQRRVEGYNFDIRKNLLEYDDVTNDQRKVIYQQRYELLKADDIANTIVELREEVVQHIVNLHIQPQSLDETWDINGLESQLYEDFAVQLDIHGWLKQDDQLDEQGIQRRIHDAVFGAYQDKERQYEPATLRDIEKMVMLQVLDSHWKEHLAAMDYLRQGIHLRGYAQKNPSQEYKRESFELFKNMLEKIKIEVVSTLSRLELTSQQQVAEQQMQPASQQLHCQHDTAAVFPQQQAEQVVESEQQLATEKKPQPVVRDTPKVGRNDACPCGSRKKYKQCHGRLG